MSADERLAIWRYATPEERQRVIDGEWANRDSHLSLSHNDVLMVHGHICCPWGAAFDGYEVRITDDEFPGWPTSSSVGQKLAYRLNLQERRARLMAADFMSGWDSGEISRDDLIAYLRRLNNVEATQ